MARAESDSSLENVEYCDTSQWRGCTAKITLKALVAQYIFLTDKKEIIKKRNLKNIKNIT